MLGCIPLCRAEDMLPLLEKCEEYADKKHHPDFVPLITYVRENWVNRMGAENLSLYGSDEMTNNPLESFFRQFNTKVQVPHPNVYKFMDKYRYRGVKSKLSYDVKVVVKLHYSNLEK